MKAVSLMLSAAVSVRDAAAAVSVVRADAVYEGRSLRIC